MLHLAARQVEQLRDLWQRGLILVQKYMRSTIGNDAFREVPRMLSNAGDAQVMLPRPLKDFLKEVTASAISANCG